MHLRDSSHIYTLPLLSFTCFVPNSAFKTGTSLVTYFTMLFHGYNLLHFKTKHSEYFYFLLPDCIDILIISYNTTKWYCTFSMKFIRLNTISCCTNLVLCYHFDVIMVQNTLNKCNLTLFYGVVLFFEHFLYLSPFYECVFLTAQEIVI